MTIKDLNKAVKKALKSVGVLITPTSSKKREESSCAYVKIGMGRADRLPGNRKQQDYTVRIVYFPQTPIIDDIEILNTREKLSELFLKPLLISDDVLLHPADYDDDVNEGVITATFEVSYVSNIIDTNEYENLDILVMN